MGLMTLFGIGPNEARAQTFPTKPVTLVVPWPAGGTGMGLSVDSGDFRMLVVWTENRTPRFPDSATLVAKRDRIISESPYGIGGPKGMDPEAIRIPHDAFKKAIDDPAHLAIVKELSHPVIYENSKDCERFATRIIEERRALIKGLGLGQINRWAA
jgi:tripartite-type tricarboxylate transporter receptor subunit TctC